MIQEYYSGVFLISLENIFKSVTESNFRKSSDLYINSSEGVCNWVCF